MLSETVSTEGISAEKVLNVIPRDKRESFLYYYYRNATALKMAILSNLSSSFPGYDRFSRCGVKTYYCKSCRKISAKNLRPSYCNNYKWCPICARREASVRSHVVAKAIAQTIIDYREQRIELIPCLLTLTLHRDPLYPLDKLLNTISYAWSLFYNGGDKREVMYAKRHGIYNPWWKKYFVPETYFRIEIPYHGLTIEEEQKPYCYGVHMHLLVLRKLDTMVPLGIENTTGRIASEDGLRSQWTTWLKISWEKHMPDFPFPHPEGFAAQADIHVAFEKKGKIKIPLVRFFQSNPTDAEIEEKVFQVCKETCKYLMKAGDFNKLIEDKKLQAFLLCIRRKQLSGNTGKFKTNGILGNVKKKLKQAWKEKNKEENQNDQSEIETSLHDVLSQEEKEINEKKKQIRGNKAWGIGGLCPVCNANDVHYGYVNMAEAKITEKRHIEEKKIKKSQSSSP